MTLRDFKEKYCRKSLESKPNKFRPDWFIKSGERNRGAEPRNTA